MQNTKYNQISQKLQSGFFGFWVKNRKMSLIVVTLISIMGISSLITIPKESSPEIDLGIISVVTIYQGATPTDIDNLITDKIEKDIKNVDEIKKITSTSTNGVSNIMIEFENTADMTKALSDIKDKVDKVSLPSEAETPIVQDVSTNNEMMFSVIIYGDAKKFSPFYIKEKGRILKENIEGLGGINKIDFDSASNSNQAIGDTNGNGDDFYNIEVLLDKNKVESLGLSIGQITQTINARNKNQPLGNHTIGNLGYDFRIQGELQNIQSLGGIPITTPQGTIKLKDISNIQKNLKTDKIQKAGTYKLSGQNYVSLVFNKKSGESIFKASNSAKEILENEFQKTEYKGLSYVTTFDLSDNIKEDYSKLGKNAIQTLVLVFLSLLLFIGFKESLIATITLPLAFFITFFVLKSMGFSLNFLTNFSFLITFGIAIDTTIVVIEGAHEKMKQGFKPIHAILIAVREYKAALISGTATTVIVFVPLMTLPGVMGKFLAYIPITIFITLVSALLISLTLNSALYYKLSKPRKYFNSNIGDVDYMKAENKLLLEQDKQGKTEKPEHKKDFREKTLGKIENRYNENLNSIISNPKKRIIAIITPIVALILSFIIISPNLGFELVPSNDDGYLYMSIQGPNNADKDYMKQYIPELENAISQEPEVKIYYLNIAGDTINTTIELLPIKERKKLKLKNTQEFQTLIEKKLNKLQSYGLLLTINPGKKGPSTEQPIGIKITTNDNTKLNVLKQVAGDFKRFLEQTPGTKNIEISSKDSPGQFVYTFDKIKMTLLGLNPNNFGLELFGITNGLTAGSIKGKYDYNDIKVYYNQTKDHITPQTLNESNINTSKGKINFGNISKESFEKSTNSISRENNKVLIKIGADAKDGFKSEKIQTELISFAKSYNFPKDISYSIGGEAQENKDLINTIMISFIIALLGIFMILVLQFNSYSQPIIIMFSVLAGLLGGNIGLWIMGQPYSMMFGIGFIALTGIIVNDSIVLIDRINKNIEKGMTKLEATKEAGNARLQPIILTSLTTFLGMTSLLADQMWQGLAITIMVGIIFGSLTTLFVIPNLYLDSDKLKIIFKKSIIKYIIYILTPITISIGIITLIMLLGINTNGLLQNIILASFIGFSVWFIFYTIHARKNTGQTFIQKRLGLKILNKDKSHLSTKQATKRFFISLGLLFGPIILGMILGLLIGLIDEQLSFIIKLGIPLVGYTIIIYKNLILTWTKDTNLIDKICNTITINKSNK